MTFLSNTSIDYESLVAELESSLKTKDTFKALFPGETSKVFTEHGAGITALMLFHIHSAIQNGFMPTAFSKSAVYALASSLGNPPTRKLGAQVTLEVTVNTVLAASVTLPKFSRFSGRSLEWYTVEDVIIPAGAAGQVLELQVRQGERITETFQANGKDFQRIEIGEDFNVDDQFLTVTVDGTDYNNNGSTLLNAEQDDLVFSEQTSSNGRVIILFGNSIIGTVPTLGLDIEISYANTIGINSNSSITNDTFQFLSDIDIGGGTFLQMQGVSTTTSAGGANEQSVDVVKATSPRLFAANQRAVRRDDYEGHIIDFTGSLSAKAWGEYEEAQQKGFESLTMMNRAYITSIPNNLSFQNNTFDTGDDIVTTFNTNLGLTNIIPGSIYIESTDSVDDFDDHDGRGLLTAPTVSFDEVDGTEPSDASNEPGVADQAWNGNLANSYTSSVTPTIFAPIRLSYDFGIGNEQLIRSLRIAASSESTISQRAFPKLIKVLGSTLASPDITNANDWEVIRGNRSLEEPGASNYSEWVPVDDPDNSTAYRHVGIEILDRHGNSSYTNVADIQVQNDANSSKVDYATGDVTLIFQDPPNGDLVSNALTGNLSSLQKDDLLVYLNDLNHFTTLINYRDPVAKLVSVIADVYYLDGFEPISVLSLVQAAIDDLFETKFESISKPVYLSDIYQAIQDVEGVDYSIVEEPLSDIQLEINEWAVLLTKQINIFPTNR